MFFKKNCKTETCEYCEYCKDEETFSVMQAMDFIKSQSGEQGIYHLKIEPYFDYSSSARVGYSVINIVCVVSWKPPYGPNAFEIKGQESRRIVDCSSCMATSFRKKDVFEEVSNLKRECLLNVDIIVKKWRTGFFFDEDVAEKTDIGAYFLGFSNTDFDKEYQYLGTSKDKYGKYIFRDLETGKVFYYANQKLLTNELIQLDLAFKHKN